MAAMAYYSTVESDRHLVIYFVSRTALIKLGVQLVLIAVLVLYIS